MNGNWVILDTNIVSYLMKGNREARMYEPHVRNRSLAISFITVGELYYGAEKRNWGEIKRKRLEAILSIFAVRQRTGKTIAPNDAWISACALRHAVPLVTHNGKHFEGVPGLQVITESSSASQRRGPNWT